MTAKIKIRQGTSGEIIVTFPYNPDYVEKIKAIKGHGWHPEEKHWSFQYSDRVLTEILSVFVGKGVDIDPSLQAMKSLNQKERMENDIKVITFSQRWYIRNTWDIISKRDKKRSSSLMNELSAIARNNERVRKCK